jgi:hypothetical protein
LSAIEGIVDACAKPVFTNFRCLAQAPLQLADSIAAVGPTQAAADSDYMLANRRGITQNERIMKFHLLLIGMVMVVLACSSLRAQEKASLQPNATVLTILQGNTGKTVELRMTCGEKIGGKVEQVNDNVVLLSHLTGAEYFDGFVNMKDISAVIVRTAGK